MRLYNIYTVFYMSKLGTNLLVNGTISYTGNTKIQPRAIYSGRFQAVVSVNTMNLFSSAHWTCAILSNIAMPAGYTTSNLVLQVCDGNYNGINDTILTPYIVNNLAGTYDEFGNYVSVNSFSAWCTFYGYVANETITLNYVVYLMV